MPRSPAPEWRTCFASWVWMLDAWPSNEIWKYFPGRDGRKRLSKGETATKSCNL